MQIRPPPTMAFLPGAPRLLCSLFLWLSLSTLLARAATHRHEWEVSYQFKSPDCVRKLSATINGQTPGPTIRATQGDTVEVKVRNSLLTENLAIHWHGIRQIGTPWADGTEGVTQCPILPGDTFTYAFAFDRPGTYMYHAHYGMQRSAGLNGLIVVAAKRGGPDAEPFAYDGEHEVLLNDWWHKSTYERSAGLYGVIVIAAPGPGGGKDDDGDDAEPFAYDEEHDVLLNDWWHGSTYEQEQAAGLASVPMVWVGEPHSLLINGRSRFNCSAAVPGTSNASSQECATPVFAVVPRKTYRFRIASVTSLSALNFEIEGHEMTVVEADGHHVKPFVVKNLNIYSGETYSVLIKADQDPNRNYWLASNVVSREPATPTGTAILSYSGDRAPPSTTPPRGPAWNDTMYFWVLGYFDPAVHPAKHNLKDPILKNTVAVHPYGWTALRFSADNPGVWAFHCHIESHFFMGMDIVFEEGVERPGAYMYHAGMQRSAGLNLNGLIVNVPLNDWWHKSTYERATGLASVPLVWVGEPQSPLINGRGRIYRFRLASITSLSALIFEIEDRNALFISHPAPAVPSGSTSSRRPPMSYGAAVVSLILCLFLAGGHPVADQNPAADESTMARSGPVGSASGSLPAGGGHTASPSRPSASSSSSTDPAHRNRSSATSSTPGEEDPSGPPGSPPQRPIVSPAVPRARNEQGPLLTVVLALLGYSAAALAGILTEFERTVGTWSTAPEAVYGVFTVVAIALLAVGLMAAVWHARAGNSSALSVCAFCARLGAILFTSLLVVAFSSKLGRWARVAAVPSAAVIACIMAAVWIWGDEHAVANAVVSTCWGRILGQRCEIREPAAAGDVV